MAYIPGVGRVFYNWAVGGVTLTGAIAETSFGAPFPRTIKAGTFGPNTAIEIWTNTIVSVSNANNKFFRIKIGGVTVFEQNMTSMLQLHRVTKGWNRGALNSQVWTPGSGTSFASGVGTTTLALNTTSIDFSVDQTLDLTAEIATASETMTINAIEVKFYNPPS